MPPGDTEASCVEGVQPEAPAQVSRTNALITFALLPPLTRFVANERKTTYRPSAVTLPSGFSLPLTAGATLSPLDVAPPKPAETGIVEDVQPDATPRHVSATKTYCAAPGVSVEPSVEASTKTVKRWS